MSTTVSLRETVDYKRVSSNLNYTDVHTRNQFPRSMKLMDIQHPELQVHSTLQLTIKLPLQVLPVLDDSAGH